MKSLILIVMAIFFIGALVLWGPMSSNVEQPKFNVIKSDRNIEIRDYAPQIIATTVVAGERDKAANEGFRKVANYIFGDNTSDSEIAMTAPVKQQSSEKIAMTAPVVQQKDADGTWTVSFVMPEKYSIESLPKPNDAEVILEVVPQKRYAVIRFRGTWREKNLEKNTQILLEYMQENDLTPISQPIYAFYNPPWTLPFLRHNEVMLEVKQ